MGSMDLLAVCSSAGCGRLFCCLGLFDPEGGHQCGVCEAYQTQALFIRKHAAQFNLLASGRSTSHLLKLVRNDYLLHRLADVAVGTLGSALFMSSIGQKLDSSISVVFPFSNFLRPFSEWCGHIYSISDKP